MSCLAADTQPDLPPPPNNFGWVQEGCWNSRLTMFVLASLWNMCFCFKSVQRKMELDRETLHRGTQSEWVISFKGTLTLSQLMKEMETQRRRQFQLVWVEAGGDSCQGDKSCEHEVWLLRHWFFFLHLVFPPPLLSVSQSYYIWHHVSASSTQPPHLSLSSRGRGWGPRLFSFFQDHRQSHGYICDEWWKISLTVTKEIFLLFTASQQV